ncbi:MAG: SRPBCC domain-containing protein [Candidatus Nanopelagicales bacterium]
MPIPNTITRTLDLAHPQEKVWGALTTIDGITGWFGSHAEGELTPGHDVHMRWKGHGDMVNILAIKVVDPMSVFAYTWGINGAPDGDPRRTYVEFALEPTASGTRLTVSESGFAQLPDEWLESSYQGNVEGWRAELSKLEPYLDAA